MIQNKAKEKNIIHLVQGPTSAHSSQRKHNHAVAPFNPPNLKLPKEWLKYGTAIGNLVEGTLFLPFKTPLHDDYYTKVLNRVKKEDEFRIEDIRQFCIKNRVTLGLVLDLTGTDRYYDANYWVDSGVSYIKIPSSGHEVHENKHAILKFIKEVEKFWNVPKNKGKAIGVHCTHGLNRTGYMICRYMIEKMNVEPVDAIQRFQDARGYEMARQEYVKHLMSLPSPKNSPNSDQ
uniref:TYR_PHOSPHATASE_2 domain-containing protein n=1 Tax=Rhabditophanes sp. KR3021 TaxID=114890 RepID=A0AC35U257_9BILA